MNLKKIFISGTGTDVGKTFIAGALLRGLSAQFRISYFKPVQTGHPDSDTDRLRHALSDSDRITFEEPLFVYDLPASPDQAAEAEQRDYPDLTKIMDHIGSMSDQVNIIEGAGGLMVPLNAANDTWISLLSEEKIPVLLVAASGLGTINHTGLSIEALKLRGIPIIGVVLSGPLHPANESSIARMYPEIPIISFDHFTDTNSELFADACSKLAEFVLTNAIHYKSTENLTDTVDRHVWFPYSQHQTMKRPARVASAKGVWLTMADGSRLIDGISSWWVNNIGHGRREIADAIHLQQQTADHTIFAGMWHEPAARLAKNLIDISGPHLSRVFFSDNGSTALEVALKIAFQSFSNTGKTGRHLFLSLKGSYHGDTFGAMSISDSGGFHGHFKPLMFSTTTVAPATSHASSYCPSGMEDLPQRLREFDEAFDRNHSQLAGVVIEPLVMGAAGMLMQPPAYLQYIAQRCRSAGIPLIADEVFTGFCRTGAWFAYQRAGIEPDIIACAKGITGGTMPLAATLAREDYFNAFLSEEKSRALMHGHSYTANPIGCAAANAAIAIQHRENLNDRALVLESSYNQWISQHAEKLGIEQARALGGILAFELPGSGASNYFHSKAAEFTAAAANEGLFLRPLGNTVYFMPPLTITAGERSESLKKLARAVEASQGK